MPRQRRGPAPSARSASTRPTIPPARVPSTQQRSASSAAHPPATGHPPAAKQSSGLFGQMASTAAGVAIGSSVGHAIGGWFGSDSSQAPANQQNEDSMSNAAQDGTFSNNSYAVGCNESAKAFTKCLDENKGEYQMSICSWYLDQLKACQAAASKY